MKLYDPEAVPIILTGLFCFAPFAIAGLGITRTIVRNNRYHNAGKIEKSLSEMTVGDARGLTKSGSRSIYVDGDNRTLVGRKPGGGPPSEKKRKN